MPNIQAADSLNSVRTQSTTNVNSLIAAKLRDLTPLGDFLSGKGWVRSLTATQMEPFMTEVGTRRYVAVTFSKAGAITVVLTSEFASTTMVKASSMDQFTGGQMLSSTPTINVQPGMRVELTSHPTAVTLRVRTGTVVREDEDEDYVIVRLDTPALYRHFNGEVEELPEIVVMVDSLRVLGF